VPLATAEFGPGLEIFGAFGHGRSYGKWSCIPFRCLPGIRECGLWNAVGRAPVDLAIAADVGNDILYGKDAPTILGWVRECFGRIEPERRVIVGLPLPAIRRLEDREFLLFRTVFFPSSRLPRDTVVRQSEEVDAGLRALARETGARFVPPDVGWYHVDPIHFRPGRKVEAWSAILGTRARPQRRRPLEAARLLLAAPEHRRLFGIDRRHEQPALTLRGGTRLFLY
jgi:hypothetical protein